MQQSPNHCIEVAHDAAHNTAQQRAAYKRQMLCSIKEGGAKWHTVKELALFPILDKSLYTDVLTAIDALTYCS